MQASARVYSQGTELSLQLEHVSVSKALKTISKQSDYHFLYNNDLLPKDVKISVHVHQEPIASVLRDILTQAGLSWQMLDDKLVAIGYSKAVIHKISGTVTDSTGMPLPGVTLRVKGTTSGTLTDENGHFSLQVPDSAVLEISYVGYQTKTVHVNGQSTLNITLFSSSSALDEVVVTALGIKRQDRELGYATQKIEGEELQTVKGIDVGTSLTGRVSGLVVKNSSEFMAEPKITLRGETPLLVVNGVPYGNMSLRDIPADDIESIDFLKGATASALYGSRGGSGVITVTTKNGMEKKGLHVSVNSSTMFEAGYLAIPKMQHKYGRTVNTATNTYNRSGGGAWGPPLEGQDVIQWDPKKKEMRSMPFIARGKNNFQNFLQQGYILNNNVNVTHSGKLGGIRASASWEENKGTYPNSRFDKITYSVGGNIKLDRFSLSTNLAYNNNSSPNIGFSGYRGYDPMYSLLIWSAPDWDVRKYKDYWLVPNEVQNSSYTSGINNPYFDRYERTHSYKKDIFHGQLTLNYEFNDWLKATLRTGYDNYSNKQEVTISKGSFQGGGTSKVLEGGSEIWGESQRGSYNEGIGRGYSTNTDLLLFANKKIKDFKINGFIGGSIFFKQDEGMEALTQGGLSLPAFYSLKASIDPAKVNSIIFKKQTNSIYGKLGVGWRNLAFLEGTFRNDWASTLPTETRSFFYPSVSGSFIPSELFTHSDWLSFWKLRGSWTTYRTPADIYDINKVYAIANNQWSGLSTASFPTSIRPSNVHSEGSSSLEFGTHVSFLKDRFSLDATVYKKRMFDFIVLAPISPSSGFSTVYTNSREEHTRKGIEITLDATPVKTRNFTWNLAVNWSKYATYFTRLDSQYSVKRDWVKVDKRVDYYTINKYERDPDGEMVLNNGVPTYQPFVSLAGYSDPDWIWGIHTDLHYKNLSLSISVDGRVGGLAQSTTEMYMWLSGNHPHSLTKARYEDATNPGSKNYVGDGVKVVSGAVKYDANGDVVSDTRKFAPNDVATTYKSFIEGLHKGTAWGGSPSPADLYSTTFLKLREVALSYRLPDAWAGKINASGISVSLIGQNLLYWAKDFKYSDIDGGTENFVDPSMRYIGFDIKLDF